MAVYFIYWFLIVLFAFLGKQNRFIRIVPFLLCALLIGLRQNVGTDFNSYVYFFENEYDTDYLEIGFTWINRVVHQWHGTYTWVFLIVGTLSAFFIFLSLNRQRINYTSSAILSYIFSFSFLVNGIRQGMAVSIFFFAYKYIESRSWLKFALCIGFALLFHNSIIGVIPLFFFAHKHLSRNAYIILFLVSLCLTQLSLGSILAPFERLVSLNDRYLALTKNDLLTGSYFSFGLFFNWILLFVQFVFYLVYNYQKKETLLFNLFFLSIVFFHLRIASGMFIRVEILFSWFQYLLLPIVLSDKTIPQNVRRNMVILFVAMYATLLVNTYILTAPNDISPYKFVCY